MSSRLMPPNPGAMAFYRGDDIAFSLSANDDRDTINPGEFFEEDRFPFHDGQRRFRADVPQAQHGRSIGDDGDAVALHRERVRFGDVGADCVAHGGNPRLCMRSRGRLDSSRETVTPFPICLVARGDA